MRTVGLVGYDRMRLFDAAVALEIWAVDRTSAGVPLFDVRICAPNRRPVQCDLGAKVQVTHGLRGLTGADLVVVPGSEDPTRPAPLPILESLRALHRRGVPIAALCGGAFVLAEAGLLDGRRATTHWLHTDGLQAAYPAVMVETERLFVEDRGCWTSAGTTAGIDLCLHLVREAHGATVAASIARRMVTPPHREGSQRQFVQQPLDVPTHKGDSLSETLAWARARIDDELTVPDLARHAGLSERTLARRFAQSHGATPMAWLAHERVQLAQQLLETSDLPVDVIARRVGFGTSLTMRRHFDRLLKATPAEYRRTFRESGR